MQYEGLVEACKENGVKLRVWTVNQESEMRELAETGVDAIITNYPDVAYEVLRGERATEVDLKCIREARESILKLENQVLGIPSVETAETSEESGESKTSEDRMEKTEMQRGKNPILHTLGITYAKVRRVFVKIDAIVQKMAGKE